MKFIKLFIASAGSLEEERVDLQLRIARMNDELVAEGIYIKVEMWEKESLSFTARRKQDDFNKVVSNSDIVVGLIFDKVGSFTYEEITTAYDKLLTGRNPKKLYLFFKDALIRTGEIPEDFKKVLELKDEIKAIEQVYASYTNPADLWTQIRVNLERDIRELAPAEPQKVEVPKAEIAQVFEGPTHLAAEFNPLVDPAQATEAVKEIVQGVFIAHYAMRNNKHYGHISDFFKNLYLARPYQTLIVKLCQEQYNKEMAAKAPVQGELEERSNQA